jgi:hypothetical protein
MAKNYYLKVAVSSGIIKDEGELLFSLNEFVELLEEFVHALPRLVGGGVAVAAGRAQERIVFQLVLHVLEEALESGEAPAERPAPNLKVQLGDEQAAHFRLKQS